MRVRAYIYADFSSTDYDRLYVDMIERARKFAAA